MDRRSARAAIETIARRLNTTVEHLAALLLLGAVVVNVLQVFMRYGLNAALPWAEEAMRYGMIWMAMLAGGALMYRQEHVVSSLVPDGAPRALLLGTRIVCVLATTTFAFLLVLAGTTAALANATQLSSAMRLPMIIPYLAIPIGALVMLVNVAALLLLGLPAPPEHGDDAQAGEVA